MNKAVFMTAIFLAFCIFCLLLCRSLKIGESVRERYPAFSIRFEFFGADAAEIERLITIPLEEKIGSISGIGEMRSVSEYGRSIVTVYGEKNTDEHKIRLDLREAVDSLYAVLPRAVQKPRIFSASAEQRPIFSFALQSDTRNINSLRRFSDTALKTALEGIDGVAEVAVSGGSSEEVQIAFDPERVVAGSINPNTLAAIIQDANVLASGVRIKSGIFGETVQFNTRIQSMEELRDLPVPVKNGIINLSHLASVMYSARSRDEIVRINGRESIAVSVKAASSANATGVSQDCRSIIKSLETDIEAVVLFDRGKETEKTLKQVSFAVLYSFLLVAFFLPLFFRRFLVILLTLGVLPFSVLGTAAVLSVCGFSVDRTVLAGVSVALGLTVDSALIVASLAEEKMAVSNFEQAMPALIPSMTASTVTGVLVLVPLYFFEYMIPGIRAIILTLGSMLLCSLLFSAVFLPAFLRSSLKLIVSLTKIAPNQLLPPRLFAAITRFYIRLSYFPVLWSLRRRKIALTCFAAFTVFPFVVFFMSGKNTTREPENGVLPFYIEFESEKSAQAVDSHTTRFIAEARKLEGVLYVRSEAKKGSLEADIIFEGNNRRVLAEKLNALFPFLYEGFLYIPDIAREKTGTLVEIQVAVLGDDALECRELAKKAARSVAESGIAEQTVLNFKEPEKTLLFIPDRIKLEKNGLTVSSVAANLRWLLFGPVTGKWIRDGVETDIRILGKDLQGVSEARAANLYLPVKTGGIRLDTLGTLERSAAVGKIYRKDGRRAAYLTVHIGAASTEAALIRLKNVLSGITMPRGYGFLFPKELERLAGEYRLLLLVFIFCVLLIFVLLTALRENAVDALLICAIIPVSVFLPLLVRFVFGVPLTAGDITGMVVVSGMSVNNAIYMLESKYCKIIHKARSKIRPILASSLTGIAGSLPLMVSGANGFSAELGFFLFFGSIASLAASLFLFPAVASFCSVRQQSMQIPWEEL